MDLGDATALVGGAIAVDLANTVAWRGDPARRVERLSDFESLARWSARTGLIDGRTADRLAADGLADRAAAAAALRAAKALREDVHAALTSLIDGNSPGPAVGRLRPVLIEAIGRVRLASLPLRWELSPASPRELVLTLALASLKLLQSDDVHRLGRCADPSCGWLFVDRSHNRSRRWCSSTDCGNRDRVARHYALRRSG